MVGGRLIARVLKRCLRPGAERTAERAGSVLVFDGVREGFGWARNAAKARSQLY